jgi:hypothetical protein
MPILFMALIALAIFLIMGAMVFYAAYAEAHTPPEADEIAAGAAISAQVAQPSSKPKAIARTAGS